MANIDTAAPENKGIEGPQYTASGRAILAAIGAAGKARQPKLPAVGRAALRYAEEMGWHVLILSKEIPCRSPKIAKALVKLFPESNGIPPAGMLDAEVLARVKEEFGRPVYLAKLRRAIADLRNGRALSRWSCTNRPEEIWADFTDREWLRQGPLGVGIATEESGLVVIDVDTIEGHGVDGFASLAALEAKYGQLPETLMAISPSGSIHYYFLAPEGVYIKLSVGELGPGLDVKGRGGMVKAPPTERPGKGNYRWVNEGTPIAAMPQWLIDLTQDDGPRRSRAAGGGGPKGERSPTPLPDWLLDILKARPEDWGRGISTDPADLFDPADIAEVMAALAVIEPWERDVWWRVGAALLTAFGDKDGYPLWDEWSQGCPKKYDPAVLADQWDSMERGLIGVGTLFYLADEADPGWRDRYRRGREEAAAAAGGESVGGDGDGDVEPTGDSEDSGISASGLLDEWDAGDDTAPIEPRGWLLGNKFARKFTSSVIGDGGTGKTALRVAEGVSLAAGRSLTGEHVFLRCRVLIICLEDDRDELRRRVRAAMMHHGIKPEEVKGWLWLSTPGHTAGKLMHTNPRRGLIEGGLVKTLRDTIRQRRIDLVILDPLVKAHDVEENDNTGMDQVISVLTRLAGELDVAVDFPHHTAKARTATPGDADRGRGASAVKDGGRLVYTLTTMSGEEAQRFGIPENERRSYFRVDPGKVNILPPAAQAEWFKLVGVALGNATSLYPNGDNVQTVERWRPPEVWEGVSNDARGRILLEIDAGRPDGNFYSNASKTTDRSAWPIVQKHCPGKNETQCRMVIKAMIDGGELEVFDYTNPDTRKSGTKGLRRAKQTPL